MPDREPVPQALELEIAVAAGDWPAEETLRRLAGEAISAAATAAGFGQDSTISVLFTGDAEIRELNARFRGKDKPTNVLSFPAPDAIAIPGMQRHLGDIALAYETVAREAEAEAKPFEHHLIHLLVHGFLHLAGFDHEAPEEADEMEALERRVLEGLAIADPYA